MVRTGRPDGIAAPHTTQKGRAFVTGRPAALALYALLRHGGEQ
jgi:hypothetical protein